MEKLKNITPVDDKKRKIRNKKLFLDFLSRPIEIDKFGRFNYFYKELEITNSCLLYHRIENLHSWFKNNYFG